MLADTGKADKEVLVLNSINFNLPWSKHFYWCVHDELQQRGVSVKAESLSVPALLDTMEVNAVITRLREKYPVPPAAIVLIGDIIINTGLKISIVYMIVGITDFAYNKHKFNNDMKMTKQEVKDEFKNTEGDPAIKGQQRKRMQEASQRRMMQDVPKADVVITNPTHFAVAVKYDAQKNDAPVVVAKGQDYVAQKIKEIARDNNIRIVENKPLARMLFHNVDLGAEIPPELYRSVAEILAMIYKENN